MGKELCSFTAFLRAPRNPEYEHKFASFWRPKGGDVDVDGANASATSKCNQQVQVSFYGTVTAVDDVPGVTVATKNPRDSSDVFRVVWDTDTETQSTGQGETGGTTLAAAVAGVAFPMVGDGCGVGVCTVCGRTCLCDTRVATEAVFSSLPTSRAEVISKL